MELQSTMALHMYGRRLRASAVLFVAMWFNNKHTV